MQVVRLPLHRFIFVFFVSLRFKSIRSQPLQVERQASDQQVDAIGAGRDTRVDPAERSR